MPSSSLPNPPPPDVSSTPGPEVAVTTAVIHDPRRRRAVLIAVSLALMAVVASASGLAVAQQQIALAFGASLSTVLWIINSYTVTFAAFLLPLGALGDRWGRKPMLIAGLAVFTLGSVITAFSASAEMMIAARILSGVGAAMVMPVTLAVITSSFPGEYRSKAIGVWSGVAGAGGLLGMFLSALLADAASWRWLFALPVVLAAAAAVVTVTAVPDSREANAHRFDLVGAVTSIIAVVGLVFAIHEGPERGWTNTVTVGALGVGVLAAAGFVLWERSRPHPLLNVHLFSDRNLASGSITLLTAFAVLGGIAVVLFPYFQAVLGWSALHSTLAQMPMALGMMVASGIAPRLAARVGARATMATGTGLGGVGLVMMAVLVSVEGGYPTVLPGLIMMGLGFGLTMPVATEAITGALPRHEQGVASALNDVTREFGTAIGVALLGAVVAAGYRGAVASHLPGVPDEITATAQEGIANAVAIAPQAGSGAPALLEAAQQAFVDGWQQAMWVGVALIAALFIHVLVRGPRRDSEITTEAMKLEDPTPATSR